LAVGGASSFYCTGDSSNAWVACFEVPGLVFACRSFLSEARVLEVEARLRKYWKGYWGRGPDRVGSSAEWRALCGEALEDLVTS
jgi:hypothetical protein